MKMTMVRFGLGLVTAAALVEGFLFTTPRAQAHRAPNACSDPWMNQVFRDVIKRDPNGSGTKGECDPNYYATNAGRGHWTSLDDVTNKMMVKLTSTKGSVYIFDADHAVANQGHVGCAIVQKDGKYLIAITENSSSAYDIKPGQDNGHFEQVVNTEKEMFEVIRSRYAKDWDKYHEYKRIYVPNANFSYGIATAQGTKNIGYRGLSNNCADHTLSIIRAYGVPMTVLSTLQARPAPNSWFRAIGWIDYSGNNHPVTDQPGMPIPS